LSLLCKTALAFLLAVAITTCVAPPRAATVVIVVRHAEKDTVPKDDPPLTAAGVVRAQALAATLGHAGVQAIVTTNLLRSRQTGRPLADALGLTMITVPRGEDIRQHAESVAAEVWRHRGTTVLVVGHGETVGPIIAALGGPSTTELCLGEYSNLYTLILDENDRATRFLQSAYGAPSAPHTSPCDAMRP